MSEKLLRNFTEEEFREKIWGSDSRKNKEDKTGLFRKDLQELLERYGKETGFSQKFGGLFDLYSYSQLLWALSVLSNREAAEDHNRAKELLGTILYGDKEIFEDMESYHIIKHVQDGGGKEKKEWLEKSAGAAIKAGRANVLLDVNVGKIKEVEEKIKEKLEDKLKDKETEYETVAGLEGEGLTKRLEKKREEIKRDKVMNLGSLAANYLASVKPKDGLTEYKEIHGYVKEYIAMNNATRELHEGKGLSQETMSQLEKVIERIGSKAEVRGILELISHGDKTGMRALEILTRIVSTNIFEEFKSGEDSLNIGAIKNYIERNAHGLNDYVNLMLSYIRSKNPKD